MLVDQRLMQRKAAVLGAIFGVIAVITGITGLYIVASGKSIGVVFGVQFLSAIIIPVSIAILFSLRLRKEIGGFWSFREATSGIFLMFFVAYFVHSAIDLTYKRAIDPDLEKNAIGNTISSIADLASKSKVPTEQIDTQMEQLNAAKESVGKFSPGTLAQGMLTSILIVFIVSLLFAAIFKREESVFDQDQTL
jgi:hypothetical protein